MRLKKFKAFKILMTVTMMMLSTTIFAYTCESNCSDRAKFKYPCPIWNNPGRKCTGINPGIKASCETKKAVQCKLQKKAVNFFAPEVKSYLGNKYNADKYQSLSNNGKKDYIIDCTAATTAVLATIGATYGPPYGPLAGGAVGLFIGKRICIQSTKW